MLNLKKNSEVTRSLDVLVIQRCYFDSSYKLFPQLHVHVRVYVSIHAQSKYHKKSFLAKHDAVIVECVQFNENLMKHYDPDSVLFVRTPELHVIYTYMYVEAFMYVIPHYL